MKVADLVLEHPECAPILQRHRIDFCCRGHLPLRDAASERHVALENLASELAQAIDARERQSKNPAELSTAALIAHIIGTHHAYLREALPFIVGLANKVARVHGAHDENLIDLAVHVRQIGEALLPHLDEEEQVLFPALMMDQDSVVIARELETMVKDHLAVGELLAQIRTATRDFALPDWACMSFRTLFAELHHLETDVLTHVHLENHALMPRFARPTAPEATA
ncbi:MAG TPA: iron-sulfur cluster repair di-iron protein [Myxococcota bacterium]|nr:iron-sulfur cluster repair di-iron protein [Myxococcota bacterium]